MAETKHREELQPSLKEQSKPASAGVPAKSKVFGILLLLLITITVSVRLAYVVRSQSYRNFGGMELERAAISLARDGTIERVFSDETGPSAHLAPLYPLFLGGIYRVFGWETIAGRLVQELCAIAATAAWIALLPVVARKARLSVLAGWAAAFALAILPINLWTETSGSWEQPYAVLALFGVLLLFCRLKDSEWKDHRLVLLVGGYLGLVGLLSPGMLPAAALMIAAEFIVQRGNCWRVVVGSLVMGLIAGLVITPWVARNYMALGGFVPLRSNFGLELANGNNPHANGKSLIGDWTDPANPFYEMHPLTSAAERAKLQSMGELAYMKDKQATALRWMADNPGRTLELTMLRFQLYWFPTTDIWSQNSPARVPKAIFFWLVGAGALLNLAYMAFAGHNRVWLLAAAVIGPSLIYMITHVDIRYRYFTLGLTVLLAFDLVDALRRGISERLRVRKS